MKRTLLVVLSMLALVSLGVAQDAPPQQPSAKSQERVVKEIRHELLMLPYFGVFDNIAFKVDGSNVTLLGQVVRPSLKSDAENAVKHIEGVDRVDNQIEILPPSPWTTAFAFGCSAPFTNIRRFRNTHSGCRSRFASSSRTAM